MALINQDWDNVAGEAKDWERQYARCEPVLEALARQYRRLERRTDARRVLRACCDRSMDYWPWMTLAYLYREDGDVPRWQGMLETYLTQVEEENLEHAHIRDELARYFMSVGEFSTALPYAEAAAESQASWAMEGAALANEGLQRWSAAEQWYRRSAERYAEDAPDWLFFCVRTGQGVRSTAQELATRWARQQPDDAPVIRLGRAALVHLLGGDTAEARRLWELDFKRTGDPLYGHLLATVPDVTGKSGRSEEWYAQIIARAANTQSQGATPRPELVELAQIFQRGREAGALCTADLQAVATLVDKAGPKSRAGLLYFTARFLEQQGTADEAVTWLKRAAHDPMQINWTVCLARELCRKRGIALDPVPPLVQPISR